MHHFRSNMHGLGEAPIQAFPLRLSTLNLNPLQKNPGYAPDSGTRVNSNTTINCWYSTHTNNTRSSITPIVIVLVNVLEAQQKTRLQT